MHNGIIRLILITAFFVVLGNARAISGTPTSYLQPEEGVFGFTMLNSYFEAVSDRFFTSRDYRKCQAVFLPSFSDESAVYLKYDNDKPEAAPIVVSLKFERQLWATMQEQIRSDAPDKNAFSTGPEAQRKALQKVQSVVTRIEAPLDKKVAEVIESVWDAMLIRVHYPEKVAHGLDGENYHFANFVSQVGYRTGKVWSPEKGTPSYDFVEIAKALYEYPKLREIDRQVAAQAMLKRAQKLLTRLKGRKNK